MRPRAPAELVLLGAMAACVAVAMAGAVCVLDPARGPAGWILLLRGSAAVLAALSAVAAEALLRARPWVWRASLVLGVGYALAVIVVFGSAPGAPLWWTMLNFLAAGVVVGVPILYLVRQRSRALWPRQRPPRPATTPIHLPRPPAIGGVAVNAPRP